MMIIICIVQEPQIIVYYCVAQEYTDRDKSVELHATAFW